MKEILGEIYCYIFNGLPPSYVISALFFMFLGITIVKLPRYIRRKKGVQRTQSKFSFRYWIKDNILGILFHFLVAFLILVFPTETTSLLGVNLTIKSSNPMWKYALQGLFFQAFIDGIQKISRNVFTRD